MARTDTLAFPSEETAEEFDRRRPYDAVPQGEALLVERELGRYYAILRDERERVELTDGQWRLLWVTQNGWLLALPNDAAMLADELREAIALNDAAGQAGVSEEDALRFADEVAGWSLARCWAVLDWLKVEARHALG